MHLGDYVMRQPDPAKAPVRYPFGKDPRFAYSGYAQGARRIGGTAAVSDEAVGEGRSVVFGFDPNFRAFTHGTQTILRNALVGDLAAPPASTTARAAASSRSRAAAAAAAGRLSTLSDPIRLTVRPRSARAAQRVLARFGAQAEVVRAGGFVTFRIANPEGLTADQHPWARRLPGALERAGVAVVGYRAP
jgi:hypothetical protein